MNRQDQDAETQLALQGPKRPGQEDRLAQQAKTSSIPRSLVSPAMTQFNALPFTSGFQGNVTSWRSSLINQQDGCLRIIAQQATRGHIRQEQLAQTVAHNATIPSQSDQAQ